MDIYIALAINVLAVGAAIFFTLWKEDINAGVFLICIIQIILIMFQVVLTTFN